MSGRTAVWSTTTRKRQDLVETPRAGGATTILYHGTSPRVESMRCGSLRSPSVRRLRDAYVRAITDRCSNRTVRHRYAHDRAARLPEANDRGTQRAPSSVVVHSDAGLSSDPGARSGLWPRDRDALMGRAAAGVNRSSATTLLYALWTPRWNACA